MSSTHSHRPSPLATVSPSEPPAILKTPPALKNENASIGTCSNPAKDDTAQRQILARSGVLFISLHEGVGISLPEHYKQLLKGGNNQQGTEPGLNAVSRTGGVYLDNSGLHKSNADTSTRPTDRLYALLDFDKSQVLAYASSGTVENPLWTGNSYSFDVSHLMELSMHLYLGNALSTPDSGRIRDICLGVARFSPRFERGHDGFEDPNITELTIAELNKQDTVSHQEWLEVKYGTGKIRVKVGFSKNKTQLLQIQDFIILKLLGNGRLGKALQARKRDSGRLYALKKILKTSIVSQAEVTDAFEIAKRSVLSQIKNPFLVPVKFVFQSPESLYLVSAFVHGGELIALLYKEQCFDVDRIRIYTAEILCALEFLHDFDLIYGDLEPQNILLDYSGHISICDFSLCRLEAKVNIDESWASRYQAPEITLGQAYTEVMDWWTLGILLAEMLTGIKPSWYDENIPGIYSKIESIYFPDPDVVPPLAQDISIKLFNRDPEQRLGAKGVAEIKAHPFFDDIDWLKILQREYEPIFKPNDAHMQHDTCLQDFDDVPKMSEEVAQKLSDKTIEQFRGMFAGFSFK